MKFATRLSTAFLGAALLWSGVGASQQKSTEPLPLPAHSHNDYLRQRPLDLALECDFASIEADIHLIDGELRVAHDAWMALPGRTLARLYLEPLAERVRRNGGRVYPDVQTQLLLLIDLKSDAEPTYRALQAQLGQYASMLTVVKDGVVTPGAITVVISGNRPVQTIRNQPVRYAALDGRLGDLDSDEPPHLIPLISDAWPKSFKWRGEGKMPTDERESLRKIVERAHARGRMLRFWGAPEREAAWAELRAAGVDLIGTDDPPRLRAFLSGGQAASQPTSVPATTQAAPTASHPRP